MANNNYGLGTDIASPQDYVATVNKAYENLGQPATDTAHPELGKDFMGVTIGDRYGATEKFIRDLSSAYVERVHKQTGQVPTADQVRQFIAENATQGNAMKFVQGQFNPDQMNALADQSIQDNPDQFAPKGQSTATDRILSLNDQLDKAYTAGANSYVQNYNDQVYNPAKTQTVNDLAGQGMLTQPNSRYSLDKIEANRGRDIASGLNTLAGQRAQGSVDLGKTIEGLLQSQQGINNQKSQFNKQFNLAQDQNTFNQALQNRQLNIADQIGRLQAEGQSNNGIAGGFGGLLSGATSGATIGSKLGGPGWGTAIGGLVGGLGGYFGSKR